MELNLINNHIVMTVETDLGNKACVFDTGSPFTFFFDDVTEFSLDGKVFNVGQNPMTFMIRQFRHQIEEMIGTPIDGFIGVESIQNDGVIIDFINRQINFQADISPANNVIAMGNIYGLPVFDISINGTKLRAAFDSGAMYSFVSSTLTERLNLTSLNETMMDFNPMFGAFSVSLYSGEITIGENNLGLQKIANGSAYDKSLQMLGIDAFIGIDTLKTSIVGISYNDKSFSVD